MSRENRIARQLDWLVVDGRITSWTIYSPDGQRRWVIESPVFSNRSYSTREIEVWLEGAAHV